MHPNRQLRSRQRRRLRRQLRSTDAYGFFDLLTDEATLDQVESLLPAHRERLLPPTETLAMFMAQALNADRSCQNAINEFSARRVAGGRSACSTSTAAYCRARKRLPQAMVSSLVCPISLGERVDSKSLCYSKSGGRRQDRMCMLGSSYGGYSSLVSAARWPLRRVDLRGE